jgi:hypothetical protein
MNKKRKILIFGLGHLASFISKEFDGDDLHGTFRSGKKNSQFNNVQKYSFNVGEELPGELKQQFDLIIWNFPPVENYIGVLKEADNFFDSQTPWIFVSSTSVYQDGEVDETSETKSESYLASIENELASFKRNILILRPGGLVDSERHPARFFKGRDEVKGAQSPVNLVHTHDVARFIKHISDKEITSDIYNLVSSQHPIKKDFYSTMLQLKNEKVPEWSDDDSLKKVVSNFKSKDSGFTYSYDDLVAYFSSLQE